jgi:hypothetical protein
VGSAVFKTVERRREPALVGSIPIRFRLLTIEYGGDRVLVGSAVFKTVERWREPALVGSIPIRFRRSSQAYSIRVENDTSLLVNSSPATS